MNRQEAAARRAGNDATTGAVDIRVAEPPISTEERRAKAISDAIDDATVRVTNQIDELIKRAEALKAFYIEDAARAKTQLLTHMQHGATAVTLTEQIDAELKKLEQSRADLHEAQTREETP